MSNRVLFRVANALDTRQRVPVPLVSCTLAEFLVLMALGFAFLVWAFVDLFTFRDMGADAVSMVLIAVLVILELYLRPGDRRLHYWWLLMCRSAWLRMLGRLSWGFSNMKAVKESFPGGEPDKRAALISASWSPLLYANVRVGSDGIVDTSGVPLPGLLRWCYSVFIRGRAPYHQIVKVSMSGIPDLYDAREQSSIVANRSRFWFKAGQPLSAHVVVEPMDPDMIAYSAGPEEAAARDLATGSLPGMKQGLVTRQGYLTLTGVTKWQLKSRLAKALEALSETGRSGIPLTKEEVDEQLDKFFGANRRPPYATSASTLQINSQRMVSYLITRLERNVPLDWLSNFLDGSLWATVGLYSWPQSSSSADWWLKWAEAFWGASATSFAADDDYNEALEDSRALRKAIREPSGALHEYALVLTVPESQKDDIETALQSGYVPTNGWRIAAATQADAAKASQPWSIPDFLERRHCDSQLLALTTPWMSGELWQSPASIVLGTCLATSEIVGIDAFSDEKLESWNQFTWGVMGSGKTTAMQLEMRRTCKPHPKHPYAKWKPRALVFDHKNSYEWGPLIMDLGGEYIVATCWDDVKGLNVEQAALGINISRIHPAKRGTFMYDLIRLAWDKVASRARSNPWPGVLGIDEMHIAALTHDGRILISELGKMARDAFWNVHFGTQQMDDVLRRDTTTGEGADGLVAAAIKNARIRLALKQPHEDRKLLQDRLGLSDTVCDLLEQLGGEDNNVSAHKGKGILWYGGRIVPLQVLPLAGDYDVLTMNPQDRLRKFGNEGLIEGGFNWGRKEDQSNGTSRVAGTRTIRRVPDRPGIAHRSRPRRILRRDGS